MNPLKNLTRILLMLAVTAFIAAPALAWDNDDDDVRTVTLIDEDGETYVCTLTEGEGFRVVNRDSGEEVLDFDFASIEKVVEEAMGGVQEALRALEDLEIDVHFGGGENRMSFAVDDEDFDIDVDAIVSEIMDAIGEIDFDDIDFDEIHMRHDHADGLGEELDRLRDEIRELKRELRKSSRSEFEFD